MIAIIKSGTKKEKIQTILMKTSERIQKKQQKNKEIILQDTFGKVCFSVLKSPLEIQKELRDEWD